MKLLLDQNPSFRITSKLRGRFEVVAHVRDVGLTRADDSEVWDYARREGYVIVSKDADFHQRSFLTGAPPKVVWLRLGNCSTARVIDVLVANKAQIEQFVAHEDAAFLVLD